ncbi:putative adipose-regulatory protein-domain-containing protein [Xylariaceae sp. FL0804]|nr:putative adipose-regulatory protein-domain-containing protein [Xylariaceae sp. FL0804]
MDYVKAPYRAATSSTAKRTYLGTFLFVVASLVLLCVAALAYPVFYYNYVPKKVITVPVHLQYNAGLNPYGVVSLSSSIMRETAYDVSVELTLPRSPANLERGNFMVALFALRSPPPFPPHQAALAFTPEAAAGAVAAVNPDPYAQVTRDNVVFSARRPVLLPYADPLVAAASRALFLPWHLAFPARSSAATQTLTVPMGEMTEFATATAKSGPPRSLLLDVQAGQTLQVYASSVTLVARLGGVRWFMYNHRLLAFALGTATFWLAEVVTMATAWLVMSYLFAGGGGGARATEPQQDRLAATARGDVSANLLYASGGKGESESGSGKGWIKREEGEDDDEDDVKVKDESTDMDTLVETPRHAGDADDEEDDKDIWKAAGTSFDAGRGAGLRRRSSRGSSGRSS